MQHCPARAAQRLAAAVLALVLLLCAFLPRAHAAALKREKRHPAAQLRHQPHPFHWQPDLRQVQPVRAALRPHHSGRQGVLRQRDVVERGSVVGSGLHRVLRHPRRVPEKAVQRAFRRASGDRAPEKHHGERGQRHTNRTSTYEYHLTSSGWSEVNYPTLPPAAPTGTGYAWRASPHRRSGKPDRERLLRPRPRPGNGKWTACRHPPAGSYPVGGKLPPSRCWGKSII